MRVAIGELENLVIEVGGQFLDDAQILGDLSNALAKEMDRIYDIFERGDLEERERDE